MGSQWHEGFDLRLLFCTVTSSHSLALTVTAPSLLTVGRSAPRRQPSMKHARRICAGVPRRVVGELHGHISKNFSVSKSHEFPQPKFHGKWKLSNIFLRHSHIAIWVWLFLWHFNAIFLWRPFFGSLDYGRNNQKYLENSLEKILRSYPYPMYPANHPDWDDQPGT